MFSDRLICAILVTLFLHAVTTTATAQEFRLQPLNLDKIGELHIFKEMITGEEIVDYQVSGKRSQILSVDLMSSNRAGYFNIQPTTSKQAIFIGSTQGTVADVTLPETGSYVIRVYLMRSAARRGESMKYSLGVSLGQPEFADGLSGGPDYWKVSVDGGYALNLREGPSTRYHMISKLRNGEVLQNHGCRLTGNERWCAIRAAHSGVKGWVAGQYLIEAAAPQAPTVPEEGPAGNGVPFDATGVVTCVVGPDEPGRQCPFGVVRDGPGNAGVWVALGDGTERHILFENGVPVAANSAGALDFKKTGDLFIVRVGGERYEIPEAVVNGG